MGNPSDLTRRDVLKITAGAVAASQAAALEPVFAAGASHRFFTPHEFALVDELTEILIPADAHSPGARAAAVATFLDQQLADAFDDGPRSAWRAGLAGVDTLATSMHGKPFMDLSPAQRVEILTRMAAHEEKPATDDEKFFGELKRRTVHAYYTTDIGIHKEMEYKGNTLLQEFVGTDVSGESS
jgi:gluconate 2-dehydrogenase gamma chain